MKPSCIRYAAAGVKGLIPYEPGKPLSELEREYGIRDAVKLASNENPWGPSPRALEAAHACLGDIARYPDGNGFALKAAVARKHGVAPQCVTLGNGSNDVLELAARVFLGPRREAVLSEHAFAVYSIATQAVGARPRVAPANLPGHAMPYGHDLDAMAALVNARTRLVFIANPNNPTGTWLSARQLDAFLRALPARVVAVVDEAYCEYVAQPDYPDTSTWMQRYPNLIVTRTFSKVHGLAGLRVGYGISHPSVADLMNRVRQPFNLNAVAQAASLAALEDAGHVQHSVRMNHEGMRQITGALTAMDVDYLPSVTNFLCVRVGRDAAGVYQALLREGVIVRPVANYGLPEYLRVTVGQPRENERFLGALKKTLGR